MTPFEILHTDCRNLDLILEPDSIDAIVTDPPYELGFMGKGWDATGVANDVATWRTAYALLKPGGHLLAFSGTRTYHRMVCAIEDAGFEIRDQIGWLYGSGFPKSLDVSKAIDKAAGAEREVVGTWNMPGRGKRSEEQKYGLTSDSGDITAPATDAARQWQGWGTALKPAYEPVVLAQKPYTPQHILATLAPTIGELLCKVDSLAETDTYSSELLRALGFWNTASSLNECLVGLSQTASRFTTETAFAMTTDLRTLKFSLSRLMRAITTGDMSPTSGVALSASDVAAISRSVQAKCERLSVTTAGEIVIDWPVDEADGREESRLSPEWESIVLARKPLAKGCTVAANVVQHGTGALNIDGCRVSTQDRPSGGTASRAPTWGASGMTAGGADTRSATPDAGRWPANIIHDGSDEVIAAFPYSKDGTAVQRNGGGQRIGGDHIYSGSSTALVRADVGYGGSGSAARFFYCAKASKRDRGEGNTHPTVKPTELMRYLCRLITPPGGLILDPFLGSGSTGKAAVLEGFRFIGSELSAEYIEIARARILAAWQSTVKAAA